MNWRKYWLDYTLMFFIGILIGLWIGLKTPAYPTVPKNWSCETDYRFSDGYQLCEIKQGILPAGKK